jgi:alkanesulfonate monooxygenase SsuD/methylene tetrahydromethanopterin reductase-like flavin-dependent oxidoreductase (luciferase family)/predicted kinase
MSADLRDLDLPDPALVVLVGPSGSGKSSWAAHRYRAAEIVSSDALRAVVGSGEHDLDASVEAFALLEQIVAARLRRRLTTVVDTLGGDSARRQGWLAAARTAGLAAVAVVLDTPAAVCRERNAARERPVPVRVLAAQLAGQAATRSQLGAEGWDAVVDIRGDPAPEPDAARASRSARAAANPLSPTADHTFTVEQPLRDGVVLQVSHFPGDVDLLPWLREIATAAEQAGFTGLALMDHLIQIPQVGRAWDPLPEPWVTLGALAASTTRLQLGTLVSPVTFRAPGVTAKAAATLSALSGGRAFVGVGAGWWQREHAAYGLEFPSAEARLDALERAIETMKALWAPGTKPYAGQHVSLPETTCYPRPVGEIPIIVGGAGARTLRIAARLGDGCNLPSDDAGLEKLATYLDLVRQAGRRVEHVHVTVLDVPLVGRDREDTWRRVEARRGRTAASTFAARHHAGTAHEHADRLRELARRGVSTVFVAPLDLAGAPEVHALAPLATALR